MIQDRPPTTSLLIFVLSLILTQMLLIFVRRHVSTKIQVWSVTAGRPEDPPDKRSRNLTRKRSFVSLRLSCEN